MHPIGETRFLVGILLIVSQTLSMPTGQEQLMEQISDNEVIVEYDMQINPEDVGIDIAKDDSNLNRRWTEPSPLEKSKLWPDGKVYYEFADTFIPDDRLLIEMAMIRFTKKRTCLVFTDLRYLNGRPWHGNYIHIGKDYGCSSHVGMQGRGRQNLSLAAGCVNKATVFHTLGRAVGLYHKHNRPDRDWRLEILDNNIKQQWQNQFRKRKGSALEYYLYYAYDYESIMHFGQYAFSKNGNITIRTKDPKMQSVIGSVKKLSRLDTRILRQMYGGACPKKFHDVPH